MAEEGIGMYETLEDVSKDSTAACSGFRGNGDGREEQYLI